MSLPQLSLSAARNLHLAAQGLLKKPRRRAQPADILSTVQRMSLLQIDTINIVARSPYLVLFSRLGNYQPQWLDNALSRGELMEYWAHEACFLPRSDFALVRHRMLSPDKMGWKYRQEWMQEHAADYGFVLRFPKDKQEKTGIVYESWHYRFVGINNAKEMNRLNMCLEEYVEYVNSKKK